MEQALMKGGASGLGTPNVLLMGRAATSLSQIEENCQPE